MLQDPRAFRSHLSGRELFRAQERFVAALLRAPGLVPTVRVVGLGRQHFQPQLAAPFGVAIGGDRDRILHMVQNADGEVRRLYRLGVELSHPQTLQLARQIKESVDRQRRPQTEAPDTDDDSMNYAVPVLTAVPKAPAREGSASGSGG